MATMVPEETTDLNQGERVVWEALRRALGQEVVVYCHREVDGREFDLCVLIPWKGILIIEVKGWTESGHITVHHPDRIELSGSSGNTVFSTSPKRQARAYRFGLYHKIQDALGCAPLVLDMVCYPFISADAFLRFRLDVVSEEQFTLLKDDVDDGDALCAKIDMVFDRARSWAETPFDPELVTQVRELFEPDREPTGAARRRSMQEVSTQSGEEDDHFADRYRFADPYSVFQYVDPTDSVDSIMDRLLTWYASGTKLNIVVTSRQQFMRAVERFEQCLAGRGLRSHKGGIYVRPDDDSHTTQATVSAAAEPRVYTAFNFVVVVLDDGNEVPQSSFRILNGAVEPGTQVDRFMHRLHTSTGFNYEQYQVEHADPDKDIVVRAGAGTGKTFGMISRITYLCYAKGYSPSKLKDAVAMITFTNEAADNMKQRLKQCFENYYLLTKRPRFLHYVEQTDRMQISTIHSFARRLIERYGVEIGYGVGASVKSGRYSRRLMLKDVLENYLQDRIRESSNYLQSLKIPVYELENTLIELIERIENKGVNTGELEAASWGEPMKTEDGPIHSLIRDVLPAVERRYSEELLRANAVHLGALMVRLNELSKTASQSLSSLNVEYLFVDEFQDTDDAQIDAIKTTQKAAGFRLFVVGDVKQCIYRFRGAQVAAFDRVQMGSQAGQWLDFTISKNYRTDRFLLSEYDRLFSEWGTSKRNLLVYDPQKDSLSSEIALNCGKPREVYCKAVPYLGEPRSDDFYKSLIDEIQTQRRQIEELLDSGEPLSRAERTVAVLVRESWQAEEIRVKARHAGLLIETQYGGDLYQSDPAHDLFRLVSTLSNRDDARHLVNLTQTPYLRIQVDPAKLAQMSDSERVAHLVELIDSHLEERSRLEGMGQTLTWSSIQSKMRLEPVLSVVSEIIRICRPWIWYSNDPDQQLYYRANLDLLLERIVEGSQTEFLTLNSLRESLRICILTGQQHESREPEMQDLNTRVRLICTTVHKAKGLEYGAVVIPFVTQPISRSKRYSVNVTVSHDSGQYRIGYRFGLSEPVNRIVQNSYYDSKSEDHERACEETRILYVAMTRAIRSLSWLQSERAPKHECWEQLLRGGD